MVKNKKAVLEGQLTGAPTPGRFSYAKTRWGITEKLLEFKRGDDNVFTRVTGFKVEEEGDFTVDLKFNKFVFPHESDGVEQERAIEELLGEIEAFFGVGAGYDPTISKDMEKDSGILALGYFKDLKEEED